MNFERSLPAEVDVLGRTIEGLALSWNRAYRVSDDGGQNFYAEGWRRNSFERGLEATSNFHELRVDHQDVRVGRVAFSESEQGLVFQATADATPGGDVAVEKAKAGRYRGVSLRYSTDQQRASADGVIWRTRGVARELSLIETSKPQYADATISAVRSDVVFARALDELPGEAEVLAAKAAEWEALRASTRRLLEMDVYAL